MKENLILAFQKISEMPYYKNEAAKSGNVSFGHEDAVCNILVEYTKFTVIDGDSPFLKKMKNFKFVKSNDLKLISEWLENVPNGTIIRQPCGSQKFPDFIIKFNNKYIFIECKSKANNNKAKKPRKTLIERKAGGPMWNEGFPSKKDCIYIYSNEVKNKTIISLGEDLISSEEIKIIEENLLKIKEFQRTVNRDLTTFKLYNRAQWHDNIDYFSSEKITLRTNNVLEFLKNV